MDIKKSDSLKNLSLPLGLYESTQLGSATGRDGTKFTLHAGLSENHVGQLKKFSLNEDDKDVQDFTSDRQRFGKGSYEDWYLKGRTPFTLAESTTDTLAALVWLGPKPLGEKSMKHLTKEAQEKPKKRNPGDEQTIAYRSYPPYRGAGVMKSFLNFTIDVYSKQYPKAIIWLMIDRKNPASIGLAKSIGFEEVEGTSSEKSSHVVMVKR